MDQLGTLAESGRILELRSFYSGNPVVIMSCLCSTMVAQRTQLGTRVSTEFRLHRIPRNFLTSEVISAQFRRNSAKFRGIPRNFAGIAPEITSVFRGMPKCHFRGHPTWHVTGRLTCPTPLHYCRRYFSIS